MSGRDQIEPGALESKIEHGAIDNHAALASIAISMKRIADAICGGAFDLSLIGAQVETIAWNAGRAFESGRRQ